MRNASASVLLFGFVVALLLFIAPSTNAQSGRRGASSKPIVAPTPEPEATPHKPKVVDKDEGAVKVVVGIDRGSGFEFIPLQFYTTALYGCADRLEESPSVRVQGTIRDFTRAEAIKRAKKETEIFVVWLQLRGENLGADRNLNNINDLMLEYTIFSPSSAKVAGSGRTYPGAARVGRVIVGPQTPGRTDSIYGEYMLKQAARDAAEKILSSLQVPVKGKPLPGM